VKEKFPGACMALRERPCYLKALNLEEHEGFPSNIYISVQLKCQEMRKVVDDCV
jgi:hypothetical protein